MQALLLQLALHQQSECKYTKHPQLMNLLLDHPFYIIYKNNITDSNMETGLQLGSE